MHDALRFDVEQNDDAAILHHVADAVVHLNETKLLQLQHAGVSEKGRRKNM